MIELEPLLKVPCEEYGLLGAHFYIQPLVVGDVGYKVLFMPLIADAADSRRRFEQELGRLPDDFFEVKFTLAKDFDNPDGYSFASSRELGLTPLSPLGLARLGQGLVRSILSFSDHVQAEGFVALALDEKPKLNQYYSRVLQRHDEHLKQSGFEAKTCLGGQGYALFRTGYAVNDAKLAGFET